MKDCKLDTHEDQLYLEIVKALPGAIILFALGLALYLMIPGQ